MPSTNGVYLGGRRVMTKLTWGSPFIVPSDDLTIAPLLINNGCFELNLTKFIANHVRPGDVVFDIGANLGYFTVLLGQKVGSQGKVLAYEANPALIPIIRDNIAINYLIPQCEVINKAVSQAHGVLGLHVMEGFPGNASTVNRPENYLQLYPDSVKTVEVPAEPLDVHAGKYPHIRFIKIDIEGSEYAALMGMKQLLESTTVDFIGLEWNRGALGDKADALAGHIKDLLESAYVLGRPDENGVLAPLDYAEMHSSDFISTVMLIRKQLLE